MKCSKCGEKLKVVRTVSAGPSGRTQETECKGCGGRFTCVTFIMQESEGYGNGAAATAKLLRNGLLNMERAK